ncbi:hypothetical protein [Streptomyces sp. NPDC050738]|uniref:hypothetical protein n=1 Tax=Streptomyces sp. NPDC050738 TaxID=3154744 RepID=UPI0034497005
MSSARASAPAQGARLRLNVAHSSWELIWSHVQRILIVNLGVALANLPLLAALQVWHQPWRHPVLFGPLLLLLPGPSVAAAFAFFADTAEDGDARMRRFGRAYRRLYGPALRVSVPFLLVATAAVTDVVVMRTTPVGAALVPMAAVLALLMALSWTVALAHRAQSDDSGMRIFLLAPYAVVRHGLLALMNLVLMAAALLLVNQAPLLGLAVLPGCVLFVVWRNCRFMLDGGPGPLPPQASG